MNNKKEKSSNQNTSCEGAEIRRKKSGMVFSAAKSYWRFCVFYHPLCGCAQACFFLCGGRRVQRIIEFQGGIIKSGVQTGGMQYRIVYLCMYSAAAFFVFGDSSLDIQAQSCRQFFENGIFDSYGYTCSRSGFTMADLI